MASRFDTIPTFNPFIQPAPLELVSQVGVMKEQQYQIGVEKVQSYIDKVAGIDLMKDQDKEYLQLQLSKLGDNIRKVVREDFSNPSIQGSVGSMALGIFNDKNIQNGYLGTQKARTKQSLIADIRKSKPDLYNPTNEAYAMLDVVSWLNDGKAGTPLVDNHDYYNYHDYSKEIREAMKEFKPSKISRTLPLQGHEEWMVTNTDASWTDPEVREYLNGVLSPQARQQLKIEGTIAFAGKKDALLSTYYEDLKDNISTNKSLINQYKAQATQVDNDKKAILQAKIDALNEQNIDLAGSLDKIDKKDLDFFNANTEGIAGRLFTNEVLKASTRAHSHVDIEEEYKPNEIWKAKFTQSMENARQNARLAFDAQEGALNRQQQRDLKELELGYKYYDSNGKLKDATKAPYQGLEKASTNIGEDKVVKNGRDMYNQELASIRSNITEAYKDLRQTLLENDPALRSQYQTYLKNGGREMQPSDPSSVATLAYLKDQTSKPVNKRDKWAAQFIETVNSQNTKRAVLEQDAQRVEDVIQREFGRDLYQVEQRINNLPSYNFSYPVGRRKDGGIEYASMNITPSRVKEVLATQYGAFNSAPQNRSKNMIGYNQSTNSLVLQIDGKTAVFPRNNVPKAVSDIINSVSGNAKLLKRAEDRRSELYNQSSINLGDWWTPTGEKDPRVKQAITYISNQVGGDPKTEFKVARVNQTTGEIQFRVTPNTTATGKEHSKIDQKLMESLGYKYDPANETYSTTSLNYFKRDYTGFTPTEAELIKALDVNVNLDRNTYSTPSGWYDPNGNGHFIRIVKSKRANGDFVYWLKDENNNVLIDQEDFEDPVTAIRAAKAYTANPERAQIIANSKK